MKESKVINEENISELKIALVYGQMNELPRACMIVGLTTLIMAEYFRDVNKQNVLLFIDNIFCFVQAESKVFVLLDRMPSVVGYQPILGTKMGTLQEKIASRGLVAKGIYPVVDPLDSTSTMSQSWIVGEEHYEIAEGVKQTVEHSEHLVIDLDESYNLPSSSRL